MRSSSPEGSPQVLPPARPLTEAELDAVLAIERACFSRPWSREHFLFEIHDRTRAYTVVLGGGDAAVAYAVCWMLGEELTVARLAVHPACRRRGLGSRLMGLALDEGTRRGCSVARLEVRESARPAVSLYRSLGFRTVGRRRGYYELDGEDALMMELGLGSADRET